MHCQTDYVATHNDYVALHKTYRAVHKIYHPTNNEPILYLYKKSFSFTIQIIQPIKTLAILPDILKTARHLSNKTQ